MKKISFDYTFNFSIKTISFALIAILIFSKNSLSQDKNDSILSNQVTPNWIQLEPDLFHTSVSFSVGILSQIYLDFFKSSLSKFEIRVIRSVKFGEKSLTSKAVCEKSNSTLCINGSFFDENKRPLGLIVENGNLIQKIQNQGNLLSGIFFRKKDIIGISHRNNFEIKNIYEAIQSGPRLIEDSKAIEGLKSSDISDRRSGVCIDNDNNLVFFVVRSTLFGVTTSQLQKVLIGAPFHCKEALNLDGGSSSQLTYRNNHKILDFPGIEAVPLFLALYPKEISTN
jgi:uncharacterized protein YigE (DUF2233 family)